jgi:hypothetical protein
MEAFMSRSGPTLHPPVLKEQSDIQFVSKSMALLAEQRGSEAISESVIVADANIRVPIDSVSKDGSFDAYIHVGLVSGDYPNIKLLVDSGNSTLILPHFDAICQLPNFNKDYKVEPEAVKEPWGAPAKIVTGPIVLLRAGGTYTISNCRFYACTGLNDDGCYTANFGIGRVDPWSKGDPYGLQSPLSYDPDYNFVQIDYAPIDQVLGSGGKPQVASGSSLTLFKAMPSGYSPMLKILPNKSWMALSPQTLNIGHRGTDWPGKHKKTSIAMIDTGGGPAFLSDPENYLRNTNWPNAAPEEIPDFWKSSCKGISDDLTVSLSDGSRSTSLSITTKILTPDVQGLCLVMCENCDFMRGEDGMNIGGLTVLFYSILIDYNNAKVGFKPKPISGS